MTGSPFSWENRPTPIPQSLPTVAQTYDYIDYSYAKYIGGHPLYPKSQDTGVYFYNDRIEIVHPYLVIPYSTIARIENMDEKKIDRERVVLGLIFFTPLAIHAALRKKKHTYTIIQYMETSSENETIRNLGSTHIPNLIQYREGGDKITIVMDFDVDINRIQQLVYNKITESKAK